MSNNQLVGLPTSIQRLTKLEGLYMSGNKLTELPAEIGDLRELRELGVTHNPLTVDAIRCALKLRKKGILVGGVAGEHSGYFSYVPVNSKTAHPSPPRAIPGHLTRVKLRTVGNLTQNEARPVGHLSFVSKRLSAVGLIDCGLIQRVHRVHGSLLLSIPRGFFCCCRFYIVEYASV